MIKKKYSWDQRQIQQSQVKNVAKSIGSFVELELSVWHGGGLWWLLTEDTPAALLCLPLQLPKPCHMSYLVYWIYLPSSKVVLMMNLKMSLAKLWQQLSNVAVD